MSPVQESMAGGDCCRASTYLGVLAQLVEAPCQAGGSGITSSNDKGHHDITKLLVALHCKSIRQVHEQVRRRTKGLSSKSFRVMNKESKS